MYIYQSFYKTKLNLSTLYSGSHHKTTDQLVVSQYLHKRNGTTQMHMLGCHIKECHHTPLLSGSSSRVVSAS